jgi:hypothetical protein
MGNLVKLSKSLGEIEMTEEKEGEMKPIKCTKCGNDKFRRFTVHISTWRAHGIPDGFIRKFSVCTNCGERINDNHGQVNVEE